MCKITDEPPSEIIGVLWLIFVFGVAVFLLTVLVSSCLQITESLFVCLFIYFLKYITEEKNAKFYDEIIKLQL